MESLFETKRCEACGDTDNLEEHHIIPQCIKPSLKTISLCPKHHQIIHGMLLKVLYDNRLCDEKTLFIKFEEFTTWYCKLEWERWHHFTSREFLANHCIFCRERTFLKWWDYDKKTGLFGLCERCMQWEEGQRKKYLEEKDGVSNKVKG